MSEYEVGAPEFNYRADYAVYPKGKDQSLCYCTDRARAEMIVTALNERDLLRRQVEALVNEIERPPENYPYYYDDWRELLWYERVEWWVKWSLEQAKKGGGGE